MEVLLGALVALEMMEPLMVLANGLIAIDSFALEWLC